MNERENPESHTGSDIRYEYFEHTADIGIIAYGDSIEELFRNAAQGMYFYLTARSYEPAPEDSEQRVSLEAPSIESLLVAWLNELLVMLETRGILCTVFTISVQDLAGDRFTLQGTLSGKTGIRQQKEIKAATYHDLAVIKKGEFYKAKIIFDV